MPLSARATADAAHEEATTAQWRDWCSYLRTHLALLELRAAADQVAVEQSESHVAQEQQLRQTLSAIPAERRNLFDTVTAERRRQLQRERELALRMNGGPRRAIDPDEIDQSTYTALLAEATGATAEDGWGEVPSGTPDDLIWYRIEVATLLDAPSAALYALGKSRAHDRQLRIKLLLGMVAGAIVLLLVWMLWPSTPKRAVSVSEGIALVNGSPLEQSWQPQALILHNATRPLATLPLSATTVATWAALPEARITAEQAFWRSNELLPMTICVPAALLHEASVVEIQSANAAPLRRYTLHAQPSAPIDLLLDSCRPGADGTLTRYGVLEQTIPTPEHLIGEAVMLNEATRLTVQQIQLIGPGDEPTLPTGQARISVLVEAQADPPVDWPTLAPTIVLSSGEQRLPSALSPQSATTMLLDYLVPLPSAALDLAWSVSLSDGQLVRWRTTLPTARTRDQVLRQALRVDDLQATLRPAGDLELRLHVRNHGTAPLLLTTSDLSFSRSDAPIALPAIDALATPLAVNETRMITCTVPIGTTRQPLLLTIGTTQYRISIT